MTIKVSTLKNGEVRQRVMTIRPSTLLVSWYEGVYHKVSVEANWASESFSGGRKMATVRKMITTV